MKVMSRKLYLGVSGGLLLLIGGGLLFAPQAFHATNGIRLSDDPSLLSEIRAPGGLLLACAAMILSGILCREQQEPALRLNVVVYGAFGLARLWGMMFDGMPSRGIVGAMIIELIVAGIGLGLFFDGRRVSDVGESAETSLPGTAG